jgi:Icc-related predicted phosphoesterase
MRPSDTRQLHAQSRKWLEDEILKLKGRKAVVVTHHAPSPDSIPPAFNGDGFNPAFASDLWRFIVESGAKLWVHGHLHSPSDYVIGDTRVMANPRGYPTESRHGFQPGLVVEV